MPRKNHTEIVCIIDRSGSMESIRSDAIGGFNAFIEEQKKIPGTASVSLVLFDNEYETPYINKDIKQIEGLTDKTFVPRGGTALFDAVGKTINSTSAKIASMKKEDRPEKVVVCILTDGEENSSKEFTGDQIKVMIDNQKGQSQWSFIFLAANQDAFATASTFFSSAFFSPQLSADSLAVCSFAATEDGTARAFADMGKATTRFRSNVKNKDAK
jgi:hypothetical protein